MKYKQSKLYGLKTRRQLSYLLRIPSKEYFKQDFISKQIHPCLEYTDGKARLLEKPQFELRKIQKRIKELLAQIDTSEYVFSGVKGRSYAENAKKWHVGNRYLYKVDFRAFFPSITRESVYSFFRINLNTSPDVAEILTNLTTIDLDLTEMSQEEISNINSFLDSKSVTTRNHLISGSSTSPLLSYHVNHEMFNKLNQIAIDNSMTMTIYIDDIVFSSAFDISNRVIQKIKNVIRSQGYMLSLNKIKLHTKRYPKKVTGVIINSSGEADIPNVLQYKIHLEFRKLKANPLNKKCAERLCGLITSSRQIAPNAFPGIYKYARGCLITSQRY